MEPFTTPEAPASQPAPVTVPTQPVALPPQHPTRSFGVMWVVVIGILVIAGGAYAWMKFNPATPGAQETPTPSPSPTTTATAVTTVDPTAGWTNFSSKYFTLSFKVPPGFTVQDSPNHISMRSDANVSGPSLDLQRYDSTQTRASIESEFRASHREVITSAVSVDGSAFTRLDGVSRDAARSQALILFEKSALVLSADSTVQVRTDLSVPNQILPTFKFSGTASSQVYTYSLSDIVTLSVPKTWYLTNEEGGAESLVPAPVGNFGTHIGANDHKSQRTWLSVDVYTNSNFQKNPGETWRAAAERLWFVGYPAPTQTTLGSYSAWKYAKAGIYQGYVVAYPADGGIIVFWYGGPDQAALDVIRESIKPFTK